MQDFAKVEHDFGSRGKLRVEFREAGKVLAEVQYRFTCRSMNDFPDRKDFLYENGEAQAILQLLFYQVPCCGIRFGITKDRYCFPFILCSRAVYGLTVIDAGFDDVGRTVAETAVRADYFRAAVLICKLQFSDDCHAAAVIVIRIIQTESTHVPAFAEEEGQLIFSFMQFVNREGNNLDPFLIIGNARLQVFLPELFSVDVRFKETNPGGIQPCAFQPAAHFKRLLHEGMTAVSAFGRDPVGLPGLGVLAGLKEALCLRSVTCISHDIDEHMVTGARVKRNIKMFTGERESRAVSFCEQQIRMALFDDADTCFGCPLAFCFNDIP